MLRLSSGCQDRNAGGLLLPRSKRQIKKMLRKNSSDMNAVERGFVFTHYRIYIAILIAPLLLFAGSEIVLVSVREVVESDESFMIHWRWPDSRRGRRCGRPKTARNTIV